MTQCGDVVGIPPDQDGLGDLGGMLDGLGGNEVADLISVDAFGGGNGDQNELGHCVHRTMSGDDGLVEFGAKYRQRDVADLHGFGSLTRPSSTRQQCPSVDDLFDTRLFEGR
jgi:hypothetical protein